MNSKKKYWNKSFLAIIGLVLVLVLAACNGEESEGAENDKNGASGENVELTLWAWPGFGLEELAKEYEENNPGITINIQESEYGAVHENLITALASGSGAPDISAVDQGYLARMKQNSEHFYNLYDYGAADVEEDYLDWKWQQSNNAEKDFLIGIPTDVGPMVMAYREDIFEKAGLPTDPVKVSEEIDTWEAYVEAGRKLEEATGVDMINRTTDLYLGILEQNRIQYFDEEDNFLGAESPAVTKAWDIATAATDISANLERATPEWSAALAEGDIATVLLPPWMMQNIKDAAPKTAGLWNVTQLPEGSGNFGGSFLTLPKQGEHPEEAYDFITWVMGPEQQLKIWEKANGPFPSTPGVYDDPAITDYQDDFFNNPELGVYYAEAAQSIVAGYKGVMHDPISQLFQDALIRIEDGSATPIESWETVLEEVERQIQRQ